MRTRIAITTLIFLPVMFLLTGCGALPPDPLAGTGRVVVLGTDAPLASVLAFEITIGSLTLSGEHGEAIVLDEPQRVEFGRLLGLRSLLGLNSVPTGSYTSVTVTLADPTIAFLDLTTDPASVGSMDGLLTGESVTVTLDPPLVVEEGGLAALHLHFPLRRALQVDAEGELTGQVQPLLHLRAVAPHGEEAFIDEIRVGLSTVSPDENRFTVLTRRGRSHVVNVDDATEWVGDATLNTLETPAILELSGHIQADGSLLAASVEVLTRDHFLLGGLVLDPDPAVGPASSATILVRTEFPDLESITIGKTTQIAFSDHTRYDIHRLDLELESFLFNSSGLVRGQRIAAGGRFETIDADTSILIGRVVLHVQGFAGRHGPASVRILDGNSGGFLMGVPGLYGLLFDGPARIRTTNRTRFVDIEGLAELAEAPAPMPLVVVGYLLRDGSGEPLIVARAVRKRTTD